MLKKEGFEILIASPSDYDALVAEIYYNGFFVALVSQERGAGRFDLEMPGPDIVESEILRKVDWKGFAEAVELGCRRLGGRES